MSEYTFTGISLDDEGVIQQGPFYGYPSIREPRQDTVHLEIKLTNTSVFHREMGDKSHAQNSCRTFPILEAHEEVNWSVFHF